jgi:hypothetical protein
MKANFKNREIVDIEIEGIDLKDYPDFCDAFISSAAWLDTLELLSDEELDELNEDSSLVYELTIDSIY